MHNLLLVSVDGVASDADPIGDPSSVDGDGQPADLNNPWRRALLQLHIQRSIRGTWGSRDWGELVAHFWCSEGRFPSSINLLSFALKLKAHGFIIVLLERRGMAYFLL